MAFDRQYFFNKVRKELFGGKLSTSQVEGMNAILDEWEKRYPNGDPRWLAYMLATTYHETAQQMTPVREAYWLSDAWRRNNLTYYPYYGRGYVQLTHKANYAHAGNVVGDDLVKNPDLALRADYAADIMFAGMTEGWFRADAAGKRHTLARYFNKNVSDPVSARRIINGYEAGVAEKIAGYYRDFLSALRPAAATQTLSSAPRANASAISGQAADAPAASGRSADPYALHRIAGDVAIAALKKKRISSDELQRVLKETYATLVSLDPQNQTGAAQSSTPSDAGRSTTDDQIWDAPSDSPDETPNNASPNDASTSGETDSAAAPSDLGADTDINISPTQRNTPQNTARDPK